MSIFNTAYSSSETYFKGIAGFAQRTRLDPKHQSTRGVGVARFYSPGITRAAAMFLTGEVAISANAELTAFTVSYESGSQGKITLNCLVDDQGEIHFQDNNDFSHPAASGALSIACGLLQPNLFPDTAKHLQILAALTQYPTSKANLLEMARSNPAFKDVIYTFDDHLYSEEVEMSKDGKIENHQRGPIPNFPTTRPLTVEQIQTHLGLWVANTSETESPREKIMRLTERGGAAILVGPPGTFKTTTVRKVAVALNTHFVEMRGSPGVEDRDLFGSHMRSADGNVTWVDGPLPRAFTLAREKTTIVLVDEALRFLPETLNVFITTLNELEFEDAALMLRPALLASGTPPEELENHLAVHLPEADERYYMLTLPTGESMFALKKRLCWAFTTNWGDDHLQVATSFDAALQSRFEMEIDIERAEREIILPIYEKLAGPHTNLAMFALELEDETHRQIDDAEGLFRRPLDPRKTMALIRDARALLDKGHSLRQAIEKAASSTVIPFVCPRESNGRLNAPSVERIQDIMFNEVLPQFT